MKHRTLNQILAAANIVLLMTVFSACSNVEKAEADLAQQDAESEYMLADQGIVQRDDGTQVWFTHVECGTLRGKGTIQVAINQQVQTLTLICPSKYTGAI